jgi:hypothetical protein
MTPLNRPEITYHITAKATNMEIANSKLEVIINV